MSVYNKQWKLIKLVKVIFNFHVFYKHKVCVQTRIFGLKDIVGIIIGTNLRWERFSGCGGVSPKTCYTSKQAHCCQSSWIVKRVRVHIKRRAHGLSVTKHIVLHSSNTCDIVMLEFCAYIISNIMPSKSIP